MNFVGNEYYKLNRRLLMLVGLWPYEHSIYKYCQMIFCNVIVMYMTVSQVRVYSTYNLISSLCHLFDFALTCCGNNGIRYLMDHVEKDWNMLKDKKELEIIESYTYVGSMCTLSFTILGYVATITIFISSLIPSILDIIAPLNTSRPRQFLFPGEYFIDQQKFFYAILLQTNISLGLIVTTLVGTESLYVTYVQHACGMFRIAR
ncbi:uncharacterized protein LOC112552616 [Pogonomyrmex barbatus]|uniref:Uncharacterized protein LOC112552616 n=1 Tax=Pogonomyrmex barbatus TaxID=144034 RepID=A0A8N1S545_9HYME|nr:uncharacterized protein LOC112552616 [Pogonomyrmex barbatus]